MPRIPHKIIDGVEHKWCCRCKKWKIITEFSNSKRAWDGLLARCKDCDCLRVKMSLQKPANKKRRKEYEKTYNGSDRGKNRYKKYRESTHGKEKRRIQKRRHREKYKNNLEWKIRQYMSSRAWEIYNKVKRTKNMSTVRMFGCNILQLRHHIEKQFKVYMNINNHGKGGWHLDHRVPCKAFDLSNPLHQRVCFWYKNLQPMWGSENIKKNDKYKEEDKHQLIKDWIFFHI